MRALVLVVDVYGAAKGGYNMATGADGGAKNWQNWLAVAPMAGFAAGKALKGLKGWKCFDASTFIPDGYAEQMGRFRETASAGAVALSKRALEILAAATGALAVGWLGLQEINRRKRRNDRQRRTAREVLFGLEDFDALLDQIGLPPLARPAGESFERIRDEILDEEAWCFT